MQNGALMAPGTSFYSGPHTQTHFRISISTLNEKEIKEGISRLGKAFSQVYGNGK
jgi:2-aminoadipate transaminase